MFKKLLAVTLVAIMIIATSITVSAESDAYIRVDAPGDITELRLSREMYEATETINATTLGLEESLNGITDIYSDKKSNIYLLCGENSRLIKISKDYKKAEEITVVDKKGKKVDFKGARGVYADDEGYIYISDTNNARIIVMNDVGNIIKIIEAPASELIPDDFLYQPVTVAKDEYGYTYVLSLGCYYGILLYSPEDEFLGFYGASTVKASALDTLSYLWDKLTSNEIKKSNSTRRLPYSFADFSFDSEGYVVTCTGITSSVVQGNQTGQINKISHNGGQIMYKRSLKGDSQNASEVNFLENETVIYGNLQNIVSVATSDDDYIFALDRTNGIVYIYDSECNLMSAFGGGYGKGNQLGTFITPVSLTLCNNDVLVADYENASVTVFKETEYGNLIRQAQTMYIRGDYDQAASLWEEVLRTNRNCQLAYRGMAMVYYNQGKYKEALNAAEIAVDYSVYDMAWKELVVQYIADNFVWIILICVLVIAAIVALIVYIKKKDKKLITNKKMILMLKTPFHPFQVFEDMKYHKLGSMPIAVALLILFYISSVLNVIMSGFLFKNVSLRNYNSLFTLGSTIGLVLLWSVCNWLVCTLFDGKGYLKEVFISTTYTLYPLIIFNFLKVILSNFIPLSTAGLISGIETAIMIYTLFMVCIAMLKVHEYDFFKFLLTTAVTIFFMLLIVFILLMGMILIKQLWTFIVSIYEEIAYK